MPDEPTPSPYADLDAYLALPRLSGLALSPDGTRLVTTVATLDPERTRWVSALWEVDPTGERPARRLTRSAKGEGGPVFAPDGDLLFTSARPDPDGAEPTTTPRPRCGCCRRRARRASSARRPGGFGPVVVAREAGTVVALSDTLPGATDGDSDAERRKARKDAGVDAVLHTGYPVRYWDHDLGAGQQRLLAGDPADATAASLARPDARRPAGRCTRPSSTSPPTAAPRSSPGRSPTRTAPAGRPLVAVDTDDRRAHDAVRRPRRRVRRARSSAPTARRSPSLRETLQHARASPIDMRAGRGAARRVGRAARGRARLGPLARTHRPGRPTATALLVVADEQGAAPVFRIDVASGDGRPARPATAATTPTCGSSPDGAHGYALRDAVDSAPAPVRLDLAHARPGARAACRARRPRRRPAGRSTRSRRPPRTAARCGRGSCCPRATARSRCCCGSTAARCDSWNGWSWRWNPHLMAARGYAVLLPDPALSTGYGRDFVRRGWGRWGAEPYTDLMALTDAALEHPAVDPAAHRRDGRQLRRLHGQLDRRPHRPLPRDRHPREPVGPRPVRADRPTRPTTGRREMTPEMAREHSPSRYADDIRSPMLVIHGDKDYRVPIGEGLRLWWDLCSRAEDPATMPHRFLYFPHEHHWVLARGTRRSGTRRCWPSSPSTCSTSPSACRSCSGRSGRATTR